MKTVHNTALHAALHPSTGQKNLEVYSLLARLDPQDRTPAILGCIKALVGVPKDLRVHASEWKKYDEVAQTLVSFLFRTVEDSCLFEHLEHENLCEWKRMWELPLSKDQQIKHAEFQGAQKRVPLEQAMHARSVYKLLPSSSKDWDGPDSQQTINRLFEKTRVTLLEVIAKAWSEVENEEEAYTNFLFLKSILIGERHERFCGDLVVKAMRDANTNCPPKRIMIALESLASPCGSVGAHLEAFEALLIRWAKNIGPEQMYAHARLHEMAKWGLKYPNDSTLPASQDALMEQAEIVGHLTLVADSFNGKNFNAWGKITTFDVWRRSVTIVKWVDSGQFVDSEKRELDQRILCWKSPDPTVGLVFEIRRRFQDPELENLFYRRHIKRKVVPA